MGIRFRINQKLISQNRVILVLLFLIVSIATWGKQKIGDYDRGVRLFQSQDRNDKEDALRIWSLSGDKKAQQKLIAIAANTNEDKRLRIVSVFLLGGLGKKEFRDELKKIAINDPDYEVSLMAAEAIYNLGYKSALQFIIDALTENDQRIVIYAIERLQALRVDSTIPDLERLILITKDKAIIHKAEKGIKIIKGELDYDQILKAQKKIDLAYKAKEKGDIDIAIKNAREALKYDSTNEHAYWILGNIHSQMFEEKNKLLARDEFDKCLTYGFLDRGNLYFALGSLEFELKDYGKALDYLKNASQLFNHEIVFYRLGQAYVQNGNLDDAIKALKTAIKINNLFTEGYCVLRDLYKAQGNEKLQNAYDKQCKKLRNEDKAQTKNISLLSTLL